LSNPTPPPPGFPGGGPAQPGGFPPPGAPAQPPPYGSPYGGPPVGAGQATNGKAIASLILGICSIALCLGIFAGIPAVILARMARREIAEGNGSGEGLAQAGLITGIIGIVIGAFYVLYIIVVIIAAIASN
jgi:hypothetical protein